MQLKNRGGLGCPPEWVPKLIAGEEQTKEQVAHGTATPDELLRAVQILSTEDMSSGRAPQKGGGDVTKYNVN